MINTELIISDIALDGFQVVSSQYFSRLLEPSMTLFETAVSFSTSAINALQNCEAIQILVCEKQKSIIVSPCASKEKNSIIWNKGKSGNRLECSAFARQLYDVWKLDVKLRYRTFGRLVKADNKVMLLFNFENCEAWNGNKAVR